MEKPSVVCREDHFEPVLRIKFPLGYRYAIRTTNLLERLFGEEWRRTK
jgi:hypothetical protein